MRDQTYNNEKSSLPTVELLDRAEEKEILFSLEEAKIKGEKIISYLNAFDIHTEIINTYVGSSITRLEIKMVSGVKVSKLKELIQDIGVTLTTKKIRIEAPIPGKFAIGIDIPNEKTMLLPFREVIDEVKENNHPLRIGLGKNINGKVVIENLEKMQHLLIAGSTGSGKSVCVNTIIASMLLNAYPDNLKFIMVDPKKVELSMYNEIPHLLIPVVTNPKKAAAILAWTVEEMERRYSMFAEYNVKKFKEFNYKMADLAKEYPNDKDKYETLPYIVIIIDEISEIMSINKNDIEESILKIAQKSGLVGIHLIITTQNLSCKILSNEIKSKIPTRLSFCVSSKNESRMILDQKGAERLIGNGDMLFRTNCKNVPIRIQGAYVSNEEVERLVKFWSDQMDSEYDDEVSNTIEKASQSESGTNGSTETPGTERDDFFPEAVNIVVKGKKASISLLQRKLGICVSRAEKLMDMMVNRGIVSQIDHRNRRHILIKEENIDKFI